MAPRTIVMMEGNLAEPRSLNPVCVSRNTVAGCEPDDIVPTFTLIKLFRLRSMNCPLL